LHLLFIYEQSTSLARSTLNISEIEIEEENFCTQIISIDIHKSANIIVFYKETLRI